MRKWAFRVSYLIMHAAPVYALIAVLFISSLPAWVVLAPIFTIFPLAAGYLAAIKCPACGKPVYTPEHLNRAPGGLRRIPIYVFPVCPDCGAELNLGL
jgi:hypothetical protein